jgi:bifunctional non-homologous end joining protein LigD
VKDAQGAALPVTPTTYYRHARPLLLHHLAQRPIMLVRFPDGLRAAPSHERDAPPDTPRSVRVTRAKRRLRGPDHRTAVLDSATTLTWMASLGPVELHPYNHRWRTPTQPTAALFDLDPGRGADVLQCGVVAIALQALALALGLRAFVKTSGSKGLHVHIPVGRGTTYADLATFARPLAEQLARMLPDLVTAQVPFRFRVGKVFVDWTANGPRRTLAGAYTWRWNGGRAQVALPIPWPELEAAIVLRAPSLLHLSPEDALAHVAAHGDAWGAMPAGARLPRLG